MSKTLLLLLSLSQFLLSQNNDTSLLSPQKLYYDIEMAGYYPKEEAPLNDEYKVPMGFLEPKYPEYDNKNIAITNDLKHILQSNRCEIIRRITKPSYSVQSHRYFKITAIEIKECSTILHFKIKVRRNDKFSVPKGSCISFSGSAPMFIKAVEGDVTMDKWITKTTSYRAIFAPIPPDTKTINFRELNKGGNWYTIGLEIEN